MSQLAHRHTYGINDGKTLFKEKRSECVFNIISTCKSLYSCIAMTTVLHIRASMYTLCPHPILNCCIPFFDICYLTKFGSLGHFNSIHHRRVYLSWRLTQEEHFREILTTMLICNYILYAEGPLELYSAD